MSQSFDLTRLTDTQRRLLRGEGTLEEWNATGMDLFNLGLVSLDPLADSLGKKTPYTLTPTGVDAAHRVREESPSPL